MKGILMVRDNEKSEKKTNVIINCLVYSISLIIIIGFSLMGIRTMLMGCYYFQPIYGKFEMNIVSSFIVLCGAVIALFGLVCGHLIGHGITMGNLHKEWQEAFKKKKKDTRTGRKGMRKGRIRKKYYWQLDYVIWAWTATLFVSLYVLFILYNGFASALGYVCSISTIMIVLRMLKKKNKAKG
jgi:hypothetical protein